MAYFVFSDGRDTAVVQILDPLQIDHARGLIDGSVTDAMRIGGIVVEAPASYNVGWAYHIDPNAVSFYDSSAEIGDATIRHVEDFVRSGQPLNDFLPHNSWGAWGTFVVRELAEVSGTAAAETLLGSGSADIVFGLDGADQLRGQAGEDVLVGGGGHDFINGGTQDDKLGGEAGSDRLVGSAGDDVLDGGAGDDVARGGTGNDLYIVDTAADAVIELDGEGADLVRSTLSYSLGSNVENLELIGAEDLIGSGNRLDNVLRGNAGDNDLYGRDGNDTMYGDGGDDRVVSGEDRLYGGAGDDKLFGGDGNDILVGEAGADVMHGGDGNDTYVVDDGADRISELEEEGIDTVYSSVSFSLRSHIENLVLGGSAVRGTGNGLSNAISGNALDNVLSGGSGADLLSGQQGDDAYIVDDAGDRTVEEAGAGRDRVYTSISWALDANVEDAFARGSADIALTGNGLGNVIVGNAGDNVLNGRGGSDSLRGGQGSDTFLFRNGEFGGVSASTADRVMDFSHAQGDRLDFHLVDANAALAGDQAFAFIGTGVFTGAAGQLRYQMSNGNTYVYGDTNGDGAADFMVRLDGNHGLLGSDFIL
ncbi:hypothetical protein H8M03_05530 [Sphingomonas sabuli]|uniref:BP74 N-terminal domain-containing protein n=1 Tax=Sphingomonas sabuli TaxID=2764186 RepID=A0A7G9L583_9SPHN|nr:calcium-binding protein [Sphingomonas sabuli]QNM83782.1 hypothetical protein H8M03_05530 [Sphingomonas sabuli]